MKMDQHYSEETNEILNLMARKIKTRGQERINLYTLEQKDDSKQLTTMHELDEMVLASDRDSSAIDVKQNRYVGADGEERNSSRGNSPPMDNRTDYPDSTT